MITIVKKYRQQLVWFIAGLFCTVLFSFGTSHTEKPAIAASSKSRVNQAVVQRVQSRSTWSSSFKQVAATHLEPNFYN